METTVISGDKTSMKALLSDLKQLTKFGLSLSVVFSSVAGYLIAADVVNYSIQMYSIKLLKKIQMLL